MFDSTYTHKWALIRVPNDVAELPWYVTRVPRHATVGERPVSTLAWARHYRGNVRKRFPTFDEALEYVRDRVRVDANTRELDAMGETA